jgi:putative membrane protein
MLGISRGTGLVALGFMTGLIFEVVGVNYMAIFGGYYIYDASIQPKLLDVPLLIPVIWAGFIYAGYSIVYSFAVWINREGLVITQNSLIHKIAFAAFSALIVLAIDLFMEPLQVAAGNWKWLGNGHYFDIPAGNFLEWFMAAFLAVVIFTFLQDHLPQKQRETDKEILLIPVLGYAVLCMILAIWAIRFRMYSLAVIGTIIMSPIAGINLALFLRWKISASARVISHDLNQLALIEEEGGDKLPSSLINQPD